MLKNRQKKRKGQSTIEYLILVTGVIAAVVMFLKPGGPFQTQYNSALSSGTEGMVNMATRLQRSHTPKPDWDE